VTSSCTSAGIDGGAASDDALERLDELVDIRDAALEQVTGALPARQQVDGLHELDVCRKDDDRRLGELRANDARRFEAFGGVRRRHPDVDDREVWPMTADEVDELRRGLALTHHTWNPRRSSRLASPSRRRTSSSASTTLSLCRRF
jgi:hypothetical protein